MGSIRNRLIPLWLTVIVCGLLLLNADGLMAVGGPAPAQTPMGATPQIVPGDADRCPVCAMFPARRPEAAAALTLHDGTTFYFCSNGCLLRAWLRPTAYLGRAQTAIDRLVVLDFLSGEPVDGRSAFFVAGSEVTGPMGPAIVALGREAHVAVFRQRHGGETVFSLETLDNALWHEISRHRLPADTAGAADAADR